MDRINRQRIRLNMLVNEAGGTDEALASRVGSAASYISQLRNSRKGISRKFCDRLEKVMGKPNGWMDQWLPEETDDAEIVSPPPIMYKSHSETELRILAMWRGWTPIVKQYVFGQMKIADLTRDVLLDMFKVENRPLLSDDQIDELVIDTVSETGEFKRLDLPK